MCDLNVDMVGRNAADKLLITPTKTHEEYNGLTRLAESLAPLEGFPALGGCDEYWDRSDHASFAENLDLPVAFLFADVHEDLKLAIEGRGLVVDHESFVNRMLERTGKDLGATRKLYVDARAFVFCSAALSRFTASGSAASPGAASVAASAMRCPPEEPATPPMRAGSIP